MSAYRPLDHLDHSLISPSGRMSERARKAATDRLANQLFGPDSGFEGWNTPTPQPSKKESLLKQAAMLRDLASRGMSTRKYSREADRLESMAAEIKRED